MLSDARDERALDGDLPPGMTDFNVARTVAFAQNPLPILMEGYRTYGPVFTIRVLHVVVVFLLGPEANHYVTVSHAQNFKWRTGAFGDLIPFLGDGLLTTDDEYHRRSRKIMLPAFHRERLAAATATMVQEAEEAVERLAPGDALDLYRWTRRLALRVAMKALFGLDPDRSRRDADMAHEFERGLAYYGRDYFLQLLRGPRSPWSQMIGARRRLDRVLFYELARAPAELERLLAEQAVDETLRLYPPAWIGPRRALGALRARRPPHTRRRPRQLQLVGKPPDPRRLPGARGLRPEPLLAREPREAGQGRLHPLRRRLAHVHRDALRAARDQGDRLGRPAPLPARARGGLRDALPPGADAQPTSGPAGRGA